MRSTAEKHLFIQDVDESHFLEIDCRNNRITLIKKEFNSNTMRDIETRLETWEFDDEPTISECVATLHEAAEILGLVGSLV